MSESIPTSINCVHIGGIRKIPQSNYVHFIRESRICRYSPEMIICNYFGKLNDLFADLIEEKEPGSSVMVALIVHTFKNFVMWPVDCISVFFHSEGARINSNYSLN